VLQLIFVFYYLACAENCKVCNTNGECEAGQCDSGYYFDNSDNTCKGEFIIYLTSHYLKISPHCLPKGHFDSSVVIALHEDQSLNQTHTSVCGMFSHISVSIVP